MVSLCGSMKLHHSLFLSLFLSFSRETPRRFKQEILGSLATNGNVIKVENLNNFLHNIGRDDKLLSQEEMDALLEEAAGDAKKNRSISAAKMMQLV